ncbi:MAG: hypothetical protein ABI591_13290 [Kofleriaceae bacterium]
MWFGRSVMKSAVLLLGACGGNPPATVDGPPIDNAFSDAPLCQPQGAIGQFYRRTPNPRLVSGAHTYTNATVDIAITDPDLRWDDTSSTWQLYYHGPNAVDYASANTPMIRHAESPDLVTWAIDDAPSLVAPADANAWDHTTTETPSVAYNPDAPADRRYLLMYSGANGMAAGQAFPAYAIGAAFSADGKTFTRVSATDSPHALEGQVLTAGDAFSGSSGVVADPEVVYVAGTYHLWFSGFACTGTNCGTTTAYGVSHATSSDGIHWTVLEAPVHSLLQTPSVATSGGGQPSVIYDASHCRWEMWLRADSDAELAAQPVAFNNMAGVWHATSTDAVTWTINYGGARDLVWNATTPDAGEHLGLLTGADVAIRGGGRYMVYSGFDDQHVPTGFSLPTHAQPGFGPGVITLNVAARDAL